MPKSWFSIQAAADSKTADVAIRGPIGEWGVTDRDFIAAVDAHGDVEQINVSINSRGGEVDHALSIFNFLKNHPANVNVRVEGVAMSAASIIAMAGDEIVMPGNTLMMVHNPWTWAAGNAKELRKAAADLEAFEVALLHTYVSRTGKSEDDIRALLDDETYMTADEAVANGFADRVEKLSGKTSASALAFADAMGIPAEVLARIEAQEALPEPAAAAAVPVVAEPPALPAIETSFAAQVQALAASAGMEAYAAVFALDASITCIDSAHAAIAAAREISDLCAIAGKADMAAALIRSRTALADARTALINALAEDDEKTHTDGTLPVSNSQPMQSAKDVWAKVLPTRQ